MPSRPSRPSRALPRPPWRPALLVATLLGLGACGGGTPGAGAAATGTPDAPASSSAAYPVTFDNCGVDVTVDAAPQRVVTIKSSTTEMLVALGLADRIVGAAFLDGPFPDDLTDAGADVPVLSERAPGPEAVLTVEPDLVYAGWESNFSAESAGDRQALADLGVSSYVSPSACKGDGYQPDPLTFDAVFDEITEAGQVFGAPDAAADLVDQQRGELDEVVPDPRGLTALWYSSGSDVPYVGAGIGAPQMIMDAVGLENVAAGVHDTWTAFAWEEVVAADPDVIVLVDAAWNTADAKIAMLEGNPATARLTAVREHRYLEVPFAATEAGVRNVAAASDLAAGLAGLEVAG
ncbi:putative F420-0 ABC transporter substrate-binding protein [Cellulomonas aerilata]|uniref:ABC transporter substrate-binding protein n=1 Tax=Cellulomonas aerilata TaxID=515326 RepID=A0A512DG24_9CELL|nr:putative F420-0 ABC transporter substrate-binding protein [Cellulomonas aerilata]GEO35443.1 ABC transporter substrate-binding protein [Cellulomonas aerilata]